MSGSPRTRNVITPRMHKRMVEQANVEIDYDRLADAVAKAIVRETVKERDKYSMTREWMKYLMAPVMDILGIVMGAVCIYCFYLTYRKLPAFEVSFKSGLQCIGLFMLGLFSLTVSMTTFWTNKDLGKENDRQFIATIFSNLTSLVALIVAVIALFLGVS